MMTKAYLYPLCFLFFVVCIPQSEGVVQFAESRTDQTELKEQRKLDRQQARMERRVQKLERRLALSNANEEEAVIGVVLFGVLLVVIGAIALLIGLFTLSLGALLGLLLLVGGVLLFVLGLLL